LWKNESDVNLNKSPWNSRQIARWFARQAARSNLEPTAKHPRIQDRWYKKAPRGWVLDASYNWGGTWHVWVGQQGELLRGEPPSRVGPGPRRDSDPGKDRIGLGGLRYMASLLNIEYPDLDLSAIPLMECRVVEYSDWMRQNTR
jgi:hypothetical protein